MLDKEKQLTLSDNRHNNTRRLQGGTEGKREDRVSRTCKRDKEDMETKTEVIPVVFGALGTVPQEIGAHLDKIGVKLSVELVQKTALLGTAKILRKVLDL